jgi:hypothetical protein
MNRRLGFFLPLRSASRPLYVVVECCGCGGPVLTRQGGGGRVGTRRDGSGGGGGHPFSSTPPHVQPKLVIFYM